MSAGAVPGAGAGHAAERTGHRPDLGVEPAEQRSTPAERTRFGVWLWLASDSALFASLFATYLAVHGALGTGPGPRRLFDLPLTALATFVLLGSSLAMGFALDALGRGEMHPLRVWLGITAALGAVFVGLQAAEFHRYSRLGLTFARSDFASSFYTLVGFHGLHVTFGVIWLTSLLVFACRRERVDRADFWRFETASLYWYFVDVVWVVLFSVVYLLGKAG